MIAVPAVCGYMSITTILGIGIISLFSIIILTVFFRKKINKKIFIPLIFILSIISLLYTIHFEQNKCTSSLSDIKKIQFKMFPQRVIPIYIHYP